MHRNHSSFCLISLYTLMGPFNEWVLHHRTFPSFHPCSFNYVYTGATSVIKKASTAYCINQLAYYGIYYISEVPRAVVGFKICFSSSLSNFFLEFFFVNFKSWTYLPTFSCHVSILHYADTEMSSFNLFLTIQTLKTVKGLSFTFNS